MQKVVWGRTTADLYIDCLECKVNNNHLLGKLFDLMA